MREGLLAVLAGAALAACAGAGTRRTPGGEASAADHWEVVGIGAADPTLASDTQRKALSRDAAVVKARWRLRSAVRDAVLDGGGTLEEAFKEDPAFAGRLDAAASEAEIAGTSFTADNGCVVTLRLAKRRVEERFGVRLR